MFSETETRGALIEIIRVPQVGTNNLEAQTTVLPFNDKIISQVLNSTVSHGANEPLLERKKPTVKSEKPLWYPSYLLTNYKEISFNGWHMPMSGAPREGCGRWMHKVCMNMQMHKYFKPLDGSSQPGRRYRLAFQKSCYRSDCPICFWKWLCRAASSATYKIEALQKKTGRKSIHVIISPPKKHWNMPVKEMRKKAYEIIKSTIENKEEFAGTLIFHPARLDKNTKVWRKGPHFHAVMFGWFDSNLVRIMNKKESWMIKNKGIRKSVFATLFYQLSHAGIAYHQHSITWFGGLSHYSIANHNQECKPPKRKEHLCPICLSNLISLEDLMLAEPPPDGEFEGFEDVSDVVYNHWVSLPVKQIEKVLSEDKIIRYGILSDKLVKDIKKREQKLLVSTS